MTSIMSLGIALVILGSGPEPALNRLSLDDSPLLTCYRSSERKFIKEEKEKLSAVEASHADAIWNRHELERVGKLLLERLYAIVEVLLKSDVNVSGDAGSASFGNSG